MSHYFELMELNIWEGDKVFFRLIDRDEPFFSLKLVYDGNGGLTDVALNGRKLDREAVRAILREKKS